MHYRVIICFFILFVTGSMGCETKRNVDATKDRTPAWNEASRLCTRVKLELRSTPRDPRPKKHKQRSSSKSYTVGKAETATILATSIGEVDGRIVTFQDFFDAAKNGKEHALLRRAGILQGRGISPNTMDHTRKIWCGKLYVTNDQIPLNIDWTRLDAQEPVYDSAYPKSVE